MNMFRTLRADEIDCRISQIKNTSAGVGLSLLLYKDARCDQNILDETVGPMFWERKHSRGNKNCTVRIWDEKYLRWVSKEDTGTESNTEKEKGLASDSFKRACFNWGIGRELYTAPFIWVSGKDCNIKEEEYNGRKSFKCYDRFTVHDIDYKDGVICYLRIKNQKTGKICYTFGQPNTAPKEKPEQPDNEPTEEQPVQNITVTVEKMVPPVNPVKSYIANEITFMKQLFNIADTKEMVNKFAEMRKTLIDDKVIPDIPADKQTMEEAKQMIQAIYDQFMPEGVEDGRTA